MASNYLLGERRFTESSLQKELTAAGRDETKIEDLKTHLSEHGLHLLTLSGQLDGKPPASLRYWLQKRGYPVICIINSRGDDPAYNHAVVVTGIEATEGDTLADKIVYLDPATPTPLQRESATWFDALWQRGHNAMMIVVAPPADSPTTQPGTSGPRENP
jgi:hypothetical protein